MKRLNKMALMFATLASSSAFAQGAASQATHHASSGMVAGPIALAAGIAIGIAAMGGAFGQGRAAAAALDGIARNPAAAGKILIPLILSLALIESLVIYALVISFQLSHNVALVLKMMGK